VKIYLDTSALVKRGIREPQTEAIKANLVWHEERGDELISSSLAWVETTRTIRARLDSESPTRVVELVELALSGVSECPIDESVIGLARRLGPASLRSVDAIHLATAILLDADLVIAYDDRLLAVATEFGLRCASPT
jgi:predicted nucleic acid-binding protein